ncbi:MAG: hydantoinase/oxoprolinase family protein [Deltaproteobacteria bacterium]|nr:hydantoinase/oxoprolinase family protein [Deltaproteobacteria bacterium]MBW2305657.1 hydantoinase/oxoprolinase family protein [Deltaproteobacteria bacterium]
MGFSDRNPKFRVGIDIGGTFTDLFLVRDDRAAARHKLLTTPHDPSEAMFQGLQELLSRHNLSMDDCLVIIHGTTLVTNAIIERKGSKTALITTDGFRDLYEMGRELRYDIYDLEIDRPRPLVPRDLRWGLKERVSSEGRILVPLDEEQARDIANRLARENIEAVGISFLHAYRNPSHEQKMGEIIREHTPHMFISISSEVVPAIREYERTSTTVANAYVQSMVASYLERLQERLAQTGFDGRLYLMMSNGGVMTPEMARKFPVRMLESGPAAGALGAAYLARRGRNKRVLSFDMGGTTAKTCLIDDGEPLVAPEFEAARIGRFKKGSGLPIQIPAVEMIEIGAGGGSIARVDELGLLKVGPDSAGADPGPACYGLGGTEPTVTDADLILGYLSPEYFLGGKMRLDREAAAEAIARRVAQPLGIDLLQASWGIHEVVCENMAIASRIHILERGRDPRNYTMLAMGGAGPVHALRIAQKLGIERVIMPAAAGVFSALGLLVAPLAFDYIRTRYMILEEADLETVSALFREMEKDGYTQLDALGITEEKAMVQRSADMRYLGQGHEIKVVLPGGEMDGQWIKKAYQAFEQAYRTLYHRSLDEIPVEVVNWRCVISAPVEVIQMEAVLRGFSADRGACKGHRPVFFPGNPDRIPCPVYGRNNLPPGFQAEGPAIIEELESTAVIHPGDLIEVDGAGNLIATLKQPAAKS